MSGYPLLYKVLGNVCIAIVCEPGCDVMGGHREFKKIPSPPLQRCWAMKKILKTTGSKTASEGQLIGSK